jgi:NAD(P)-dependent dehydrogenase (short-subunit alcohol dehydrogenase family)
MQIRSATALVTGANRGIGQALVGALLHAGVKTVYAASRAPGNLGATLALDPKRVRPVVLDVTNRDQVAALPARLTDVTLLVNNAAVLHFGGILDVPLDTLMAELDTNFYGKLVMARAFAPVIERNGGGAIVNMLTLVALASMPGLSVYNASKAAAWSMTQSLRASLAGKGVAVHGVFPGAVDTDMLAGVEMPKAAPEDVAAAIVAGVAANQEDIFPDAMSARVYAAWKQDHKAIERQFASM